MKRTILTFSLLLMPSAIRAAELFPLPMPAIGMGNPLDVMQMKRAECEAVISPAQASNGTWNGTKLCRWNMAIQTVTPQRIMYGVWLPSLTTHAGGRIDVEVTSRFGVQHHNNGTQVVETNATLTTAGLTQRKMYKVHEEPGGPPTLMRLIVPNDLAPGYYELAFHHVVRTQNSNPASLGSTAGVIVKIE